MKKINEKVFQNIPLYKTLFKSASPYPHLIIDEFFDRDYFSLLLDELENFYSNNKEKGKKYNTQVEPEKWSSQGAELSSTLKELGEFLKSKEMIDFLTDITDLPDLLTTDNNSQLGFFHYMKKKSYLTPHIDHMQEMGGDNKKKYHVLNIIIYLAKSWNPNWGGATNLKSRKNGMYTGVDFVPNRALVFLHSPISIHGVNTVSELSDQKRFSIYFDYYSENSKPYYKIDKSIKVENSPHLFFLEKKLDYFKKGNRKYLKAFLSYYKNKFLSNFEF